MKRLGLLIASAVLLSACGAADRLRPGGFDRPLRAERLAFDGHDFRAKIRPVSEDRRQFSVALKDARRSTVAAIAAAEYEATKYCLGLFGASEHVLQADSETPEAELPVDERGAWVILGTCTAR